MANTEDILAELNAFVGGESPAATPTAMPSTAPSMATRSPIGLDLLGRLDTEYTNKPSPYTPTIGDIAYEGLVPSKQAAVENVKGIGSILGAGADYAKYGLSYLSPIESYGSGYRTEVDKAAEAAKQKAAKEDEDARIKSGLTVDQWADFKKQEANKAYRHLGGQVAGGLLGGALGSGYVAGGAGLGATIGSIVPGPGTAIGAGVGGTLGLLAALYQSYLGAGAGELATQSAEEALGWSKPTTAMEKARAVSEAGTGAMVGEFLPGGVASIYKGTRAAGQAGRAWLGPKTLEEALAQVQPKMESAMPAATVRAKVAQQAAREQTSGMKTTGEVLNTPEALNLEQQVGLTPLNQEAYNTRLISNIQESQKFITDDLSKNLVEQSNKAPKTLDAQGNPHVDTTKTYLKQESVPVEDIGKQMDDAFEDAATRSQNELRPLYKDIEHVNTGLRSIKTPINKALENYYPKVEGKTLASGVKTTEFSGIPAKLESIVKDITSATTASTDDLNKWQSQLRSMAKTFARSGDEVAAKAANDVRTELINKIESTTAGEKWIGARSAAKQRADIINNHELGKAISKENLNPESVFKSVTRNASNAKNFIAAVGENHPVIRATKAYAIKAIENVKTPEGKALWIKNNTPWLKEFFNKNEFESLQEMASIGQRTAEKNRAINALAGSPTARRQAVREAGLGRIVGRSEEVPVTGSKVSKYDNLIRNAIVFGGGYTLADQLGLDKTGTAAGILAAALGGRALAKRRDIGTRMLTQGAYDIAMNPKIAGWTAPQLAAALTKKQAAQLSAAAKAGTATGRVAEVAMYGGRLMPKENKSESSKQIFTQKRSAHQTAAEALKSIDMLNGADTASVATPNIIGAKRVNVSKAEGDAHLATKPPIIQAMAMAESAGNDKAVSPKGARGRMQLMPATAKELGVKNIHDPIENIDAGERYFNRYAKKYGDERIALIAYNWGPGHVANIEAQLAKRGVPLTWSNIRNKIPAETSNYIATVMKNKQKLMRA